MTSRLLEQFSLEYLRRLTACAEQDSVERLDAYGSSFTRAWLTGDTESGPFFSASGQRWRVLFDSARRNRNECCCAQSAVELCIPEEVPMH